VWVGYPNAKIPMTNVHGIKVAGGTFPATIWRLFMMPAFGSNPPGDWPEPSNPVVWKPFKGQYEYVAPVAPAPVGGEGGKETEKKGGGKKDTTSATTTEPPPGPPTTTEPPPATTTTE
jgi:membrane peptidoglycan carboxypeptidase